METADFILKKVAPVFNKKGYIGTSLTDITKATQLTKGAVYCNFANKEELAIEAFELNLKVAIGPLFELVANTAGSLNKLRAIINYQRTYFERLGDRGGCPLIRAGIDAKFNSPKLFNRAQAFSLRILNGMTRIITEGIAAGEIKKSTDAAKQAKLILSMIEGSNFMSFTHNDNSYIITAMDFIETYIIDVMKK